jgi:hypothetical protein
MVHSIIPVILGMFALIKGELKFSSHKRITATPARVLGLTLVIGSILGGTVSPIITYAVFLLVVIIGLALMEDIPENSEDNQSSESRNNSLYPQEMAFASAGPAFLTTGMPSLKNVDTPNTLPLPHVYSEYIVYNIRSSFAKKPGQPTRCPKCGAPLNGSVLKPSQSVRFDLHSRDLLSNHRYTYLFTCDNCKWWCFRENWKSNRLKNYVCDFLVAGAIHGSALSSNLYSSTIPSDQPWFAALDEQDIYRQSENLPAEIARIFPVA